jgi:carboxymethylenebutenolidase
MIVQSQTIHFGSSPTGPQGHFVRPDDDKIYPGIVLIQEWWGIEPHIRELAQRLATEGFAVMVPDLYHGQIATEPDDAKKLVMTVRENIERVLGEVTQAADHLHPQVSKMGIMGFCMGGFVTYKMAERYPHFAAFSPWYAGGYDPTPDDVAKINAPVLAIYGETDGGIPIQQIKKIETLFDAAGKQGDFRIYPNAGHAFNNPDHGMYAEAAAKDAWGRAVAFFKEHLA